MIEKIPSRGTGIPSPPARVNFHRRYIVYGLVVDSAFPLATVPEAADRKAAADICIELASDEFFRARAEGLPPPAADDDWIHYSVLAEGSVYIVVRNILRTVVSADGRQAGCAWADGADRTAFEANFLNFVLSTALTLQGEEPFHATVLDLGGRVIGLLGPSGAGKSTLAACLIGRGADLVTDDMLRLELHGARALVHAGPYRLKLHRDSAERFLPGAAQRGYFNLVTEKILVQPRPDLPSGGAPRQLAALFWLGDVPAGDSAGHGARADRMSGLALARALIASAMNIRYHAPDRLERRLRFVERVAKVLPVYALAYKRDFAIMDRVAEEIGRVMRA